ncbi:MAG: serine/threonine protein kinase [Anaerolineae bacterium]|nr:serine/threonine protein kinase [Anaerolineae bacterium]
MSLQDLAGHTLGQYELRNVLGVGGMGVAYRGYQISLEREVAIKVLSTALAAEPGYIERFYREAKTAAALEHAHIVAVYDYGVQGDISYVVMRMLTGGTLDDRNQQRLQNNQPPPSLGEVLSLLKQIASALDYAHQRGVVHRDIKPSNIMFDDQGIAYVVDFGIAKMLEATTTFTASGTPMGTPIYMPPEQWRSEDLTPAADQYALGVTIYALLTGYLPFEATTPYGMMHKHLNEPPIPPLERRPDLPPALNEVLNTAMAKRPADRFESASAFARAFEDAVGGQLGEMTNFFTTPMLSRPTRPGAARTGAALSTSLAANQAPVTITVTQPLYKNPLAWVMAAALAITVGLLIFMLASGSDSGDGNTLSSAGVQNTVQAQVALVFTQSAQTSSARVEQIAAQQTGTATMWTHTPTQTPTATNTPTPSPTVTDTPTPTPNLTGTYEIIAAQTETAQALTQAARDEESTTTAIVINATATANANATVNANATQAALDSTATQEAAELTATAAATPEPNMRAVYDNGQFILINIGDRPLDISRLVFQQAVSDVDTLNFNASLWRTDGTSLSSMQPGGCFQFLTYGTAQIRPGTTLCPSFLGWFQGSFADRYFWLSDDPGGEFTVHIGRGSEAIATCQTAKDECLFALPRP